MKNEHDGYDNCVGKTLVDEFAGLALAGLLACYAKMPNQLFPDAEDIAGQAYNIAYAMMLAREE